MAKQFYRAIFGEGDTTLKVGKDTQKLFASTTRMPPTVNVLDSLAREAMRDAREGVEAYKFLLGKNELESATKRPGEAFAIGEFMPELRTLSRDDKRQALAFTQKSNQLLSALEVKDYTLAAKIVLDLETTAKDFDNSKPMAAIETAHTVSAMHLAKARSAAVNGDRAVLEEELKSATEIWPRNPALAELSTSIFSQADVQGKRSWISTTPHPAQLPPDLRRLRALHRRDGQLPRPAGTTQKSPRRHEDGRNRPRTFQRNCQARRLQRCVGNRRASLADFPDDTKLNQARANLTTEAAEFVHTVRTAEQLEGKGQYGSSLAWYLKARKLHPLSEYAHLGIDPVAKLALDSPDNK